MKMSLAVENVSVVYRSDAHSIQALEDVSLRVEPGRCHALIGESGSGKTTLALASMGLLPKNASCTGTILIEDRNLSHLDEAALNELRWDRVAMVCQNGVANMNPVHRIIDQVGEPLIQKKNIARSEALTLAGQAMNRVGLSEDKHGRFPHQLSGGEIQRALLAMAMILNPEVLILDEPTANLDCLTRDFIAQTLLSAKDEGKALLLITHDLDFAVQVADTAALLYLGQIMESLPAADLLRGSLHPYTRALVRCYPTMATARDLGGIRGDAFYRFLHQHGHEDAQDSNHSHIQAAGSSHDSSHAPPTGCLFRDRCTQAVERCRTDAVALETVDTHEVRCLRRGIADIMKLKGVSKNYDRVQALDAVDLTLKAGEVLGVVGETGSGKTTLAMIAAGVLKPDSGTRTFQDRDMDEWHRLDYLSLTRRIGVIYQRPGEAVSPRFTVFDVIAEPLRIHEDATVDEMRERVCKALANVHLPYDPAFLKRYTGEMNMGALQRICIARAIILTPSLLIADEPTNALDPSVQAKVMKLLMDIQIEKGLTMLFVTHNIALARKISDRIAVMQSGRVAEIGPTDEILANPSHPYTRRLIESAIHCGDGL
jgi:peptide/nickel transport system ATP-binding protein